MEISRFALERLRLRIKELSYSSHLNRRAKKRSSKKWYFQKEHMSVRETARLHYLVYGFLIGKPYQAIEGRTRSLPNFHKVRELIVQYEPTSGYHPFQLKPEWEKAFQDWLKG